MNIDKIQSDAITIGKISSELSFDDLSPIAKVHWSQLGRRLELMNQYDNAHPFFRNLAYVPIVSGIYFAARRNFVLTMEPQILS